MSLKQAGITNAIRLSHDGNVIFEDTSDAADDLPEAIRSLAQNSPELARYEFDELQLVAEHQGVLLRTVFDAQVRCVHPRGTHPVVISIAAVFREFRAGGGELSSQQRQQLNDIFTNQQGYDAVTAAATSEFCSLVNSLRAACAMNVVVDSANLDSTVRIAGPGADTFDKWTRLFEHQNIDREDVAYCFQWYDNCQRNGIRTDDATVVDLKSAAPRPRPAAPVTECNSNSLNDADGNPFTELHIEKKEIPRTGWFGNLCQADVWRAVANATCGYYEKGGFFTNDCISGQCLGHRWKLTDQSSSDDNGTRSWLERVCGKSSAIEAD